MSDQIPDGNAMLERMLARRTEPERPQVRPFEALEASYGLALGGGEDPSIREAMVRMGQQLRETGHTTAQADAIVRRCALKAHKQDGVTTRRK